MSVIVGVDIAKSKFDYRIITEGNDRLSKGSCQMTNDGFLDFISDPNITKEAMFVMESTGLYHIPLQNFLLSKGFDAHCVNPLLIKKQVMADSLRKTKTDSADALAIAKYGRLHYDVLREQKGRMDDEVKALARRRQRVRAGPFSPSRSACSWAPCSCSSTWGWPSALGRRHSASPRSSRGSCSRWAYRSSRSSWSAM